MLTMKGTVAGIKQVQRVNHKTGEMITKHYIGLSSPKSGGYHGESVITDLQISQRFESEGKCALFEKMKGREVTVEVFANAWAGRNGAQISWFLGGDGEPITAEKA